jgi:hypothetical protein
MTISRVCAILLAAGGGYWAFLLLWTMIGIALHAPDGFPAWALLWLPGVVVWYGYIKRAFGKFLFRRVFYVWLCSIVVNLSYLVFLFPLSEMGRGNDLDLMAQLWLVLAILLSIIAWWQDRRLPNQTIPEEPQLDVEEFAKLLKEHRRKNSQK